MQLVLKLKQLRFRGGPSDFRGEGATRGREVTKKNPAMQNSAKKRSCKNATTKKNPIIGQKNSCSPKAIKKNSYTKKLPYYKIYFRKVYAFKIFKLLELLTTIFSYEMHIWRRRQLACP